MYLNTLIFILGIGIVQGVLIIAVLMVQKKLQAFHVLLNTYIAVLLLQLVFKIVSKLWLVQTWLQAYLLSYFLPFLYGPLIFLFSLSYLNKDFKWKWQYALHFIPFLLYAGFFAFANPDIYPPAMMRFLLHPLTRFILQAMSLVIYHVFVLSIVRLVDGNNEINSFWKNRTVFLRKFAIVSLIVTACIASTLLFLFTNYPNYQEVRWIFILLTIFVYWLSYESLKRPRLFKLIRGNSEINERVPVIPALTAHRKPVKYYNSGLKDDEMQRISAALETSMDVDKIYLDADLNIDRLAVALSCQKHNLSQVLNENYHMSFNEFINQKRVAEARVFLSDPNFNHIKIASIAYDSGFNSLSSFNSVFKKIEGSTPSQFRLISQQNRSQTWRV